MSKGSTRRPATVSPQSVRDAWDRTFPPIPPELERSMNEPTLSEMLDSLTEKAPDPPPPPKADD